MAEPRKLSKRVFLGIVLLTLLRLLWHLIEPLGLVGDEAYYWEWGRRPAPGYFSKPPLIGWLYGVLGAIAGHHVWVFKAAATLMAGGTLLALFAGTKIAAGPRPAVWATLLAALSPANLLAASVLTIDAPLLLFWSLGFALSARILFTRTKVPWAVWAALSLVWGLGYLSKQMMMFQPLLFLLAAAVCRPSLLRRPASYLAVALSFIALLPPLIWNARHDWVTFSHTAHHFESSSDPFLQRVGDFWGALIGGIATPVTGVLMVIAIIAFVRSPARASRPQRFLFIYGGLGLAGISLLLVRQELNPNWPAVFFIGAFALTANHWLKRGRRGEAWLRVSARVAAVLSVLAMLFFPLRSELAWIKSQKRLDQGFQAGAARTAHVLGSPAVEPCAGIIVVGHRFEVSQLAFHLPDQPLIYQFPRGCQVKTQYDLWPAPESGKRYLVIRIITHPPGQRPDPHRDFSPHVTDAFESGTLTPLDDQHFTIPLTKLERSYDFFLSAPLRQWPQPGFSP